MKSRIILYISALLIFWVFRGYRPAPKYDSIELISDQEFKLNDQIHPTSQLDNVIREYRRGLPPDKKKQQVLRFKVDKEISMGIVQDVKNALRKNGLLYLFFPAKPFWQFW